VRKIGIAVLVLFALISLAGCEDDKNPKIRNELPQFNEHVVTGDEQGEIRGGRFQITDSAMQQEILTFLSDAEQVSISSGEANDILSSPQNVPARTIEFRIEGMWYSFHETGVLTTHQAGQLAEHFLISDISVITKIFLEYTV